MLNYDEYTPAIHVYTTVSFSAAMQTEQLYVVCILFNQYLQNQFLE